MSNFQECPRAYAIELVEAGRCDAKQLLLTCLSLMSARDVRDALDDNELSPRFLDSVDDGVDSFSEDEIGPEERNACDHYNERYTYPCND
jgi:hypothetical protein